MKSQKLVRLVEIALCVLMAAVLAVSFFRVKNESSASGRESLENALRQSVMACYAAEGIYPPNLQYLKDSYGLQVDEQHFTVHYTNFAQNLYPEITVTEN